MAWHTNTLLVHRIYKSKYILLLFILALTIFYIQNPAKADDSNWLSATLKSVISASPYGTYSFKSIRFRDCEVQKRALAGVTVPEDVCVIRGLHYDIGNRMSTNDVVISFEGDRHMYIVKNMNTSNGDQYHFLPDTDTLVYTQYPGGTGGLKLYVYKSFPETLTRSQGTRLGGSIPQTEFFFDSSSPDYQLKNQDSIQDLLVVPDALGYSSNAKYLVADVYNQGLTRIDLDTFEQKAFSKDHTYAYSQTDRLMSITSDGQYVAVSGRNVTSKFFKLDEQCGNSHVDTLQYTEQCQERSFSAEVTSALNSLSMHDNEIVGISFSDDHTLNLKLLGNDIKTVTITPENYTPPRLNYLALGDSYSSGEGDTYVDPHTNSKRYRTYTDVEENQPGNQPREKCHISTQSYPYKLASSFSWNIADQNNIQDRWQTVACSGAQKYDANEAESATYEGQGKGSSKQLITNGNIPRLQGYSDKEQLKINALNEFIPGRQKQIEFVKKYKPRVITLTMGGNDVGFGSRIGVCLVKGFTCPTANEDGRKDLGVDAKKEFSGLKSFYNSLKDASRDVKIYVLGYPQAIVDDENASCSANVNGLDDIERKLIVAGYGYMNQVIKTAAQSEGVQYVDVEEALAGHKLCESGSTYVSGLSTWGSSELQETFHPNADGHSLIANKFYEELDYENPLTYSDYASDANTSLTEANILNSAYLQTATPSTRNVEYKATTEPEQTRSSAMSVLVNKFTFLAGSTVQMVLHSDPVDLGTVTVATDGSMNATPIIPSTVPPGYHTLIISGQTPSGESIEYEQIILVKGEDPDDIDDNSVSDDQQVCGPFITPANEDADYDGIDDACDPEITDPILYVVRNGDIAKGEDSAKLYVYRNTRASSITGITTDYVDTSTNLDNKEALIATSLDTQTSAIFNKFVMLEDSTDPSIKIPTVLAKDSNNQCLALQPTNYLSPALNPTDQNYAPRGLTKLTQLPEGENCE